MTRSAQTTLVLVLLVTLPSSILRATEIPDQTIETIQKVGGTMVCDETIPGRSVIAVDLSFTEFTDTGIKGLASLRQLQSLNLERTSVTDLGLKELTGFQQLRSLDLSCTRTTDTGLKELVGLPQLQSLDLSCCLLA